MTGDDASAAVERLQAQLRELQERYAVSQAALDDRDRALAEAHEQQAATADIVRVIASSPTALQPVLDALVASVARLTGATLVVLWRVEGDLRIAAAQHAPEGWALRAPVQPLDIDTVTGRAILQNETVYSEDTRTDERFTASRERHHLTAQHVALVDTFADQAVIAIENARLFEELQEANRALEIASRHKSQFLANMSHELRTPLNAIIGYSEMLQEEAEETDAEAFLPDLQRINTAGKHLLGLINDILDLSKIEAGRMDLDLSTFEISHLVQDVAAIVQPLVEKNGNSLVVTCPDDLGTMHADQTRLRQTLFNLLSNAAKFTERGTITLRVALTPRPPPDFMTVCEAAHRTRPCNLRR